MNYKKLTIILSVLLIISIAYHVATNKTNENYDSIINSKIYNINNGIEELSSGRNSNIYDTIIALTEIKQDCITVSELAAYNHNPKNELTSKSDEIAIGDLLGDMYFYIDDIKPENLNRETIDKIIKELEQVNTIFTRVKRSNYKNQNEYFSKLREELTRDIERYPENTILLKFSKRETENH